MKNGAQLFVESLEVEGVEIVFGLPGAKIDPLFDALIDSSIRMILCRHEQHAALMAQVYGRITGRPGVVIATSGPGVANLVTGLLTATTEGDPVVAIGGSNPRSMRYKKAYQIADNVSLTKAATKSSVEIVDTLTIPDVCAQAFRKALEPRRGAVFISVPKDVLLEKVAAEGFKERVPFALGPADEEAMDQAVALIDQAESPVFLLGMEASQPGNCAAIRDLIRECPLPVASTYQGAGVIPRELEHLFAGRVGLFKNQIADKMLDQADTIVAIGFFAVEYDSGIWNKQHKKRKIIHIDCAPADLHLTYNPSVELIGDIAKTVALMKAKLKNRLKKRAFKNSEGYRKELEGIISSGASKSNMPMHPLRFIHDLRSLLDDEALVICDIGSVYMWMSRYFLSYSPRHYLTSNGQQTLGIALPWAIATRLIFPEKKILSISGDGGFLISSQELETAVRENLSFVHCVWVDGAFDMVKQQQQINFKRECMVKLGSVDLVKYAESFGALGYRVEQAAELIPTLKKALASKRPCIVEIAIDYSENRALFETMKTEIG
ncbi:MAG: acetolactate synthase AlsS [Chlamydiae bacterium]|nr:acetolactate synthase AlsS [Chlamydiota bacterium]